MHTTLHLKSISNKNMLYTGNHSQYSTMVYGKAIQERVEIYKYRYIYIYIYVYLYVYLFTVHLKLTQH